MSPDDCTKLAKRASGGDTEATTKLFFVLEEELAVTIKSELRRAGRQDLSPVEDILHEIYLVARKDIRHLRSPESIKSWFKKVAKNRTLRFLLEQDRERRVADKACVAARNSDWTGTLTHANLLAEARPADASAIANATIRVLFEPSLASGQGLWRPEPLCLTDIQQDHLRAYAKALQTRGEETVFAALAAGGRSPRGALSDASAARGISKGTLREHTKRCRTRLISQTFLKLVWEGQLGAARALFHSNLYRTWRRGGVGAIMRIRPCFENRMRDALREFSQYLLADFGSRLQAFVTNPLPKADLREFFSLYNELKFGSWFAPAEAKKVLWRDPLLKLGDFVPEEPSMYLGHRIVVRGRYSVAEPEWCAAWCRELEGCLQSGGQLSHAFAVYEGLYFADALNRDTWRLLLTPWQVDSEPVCGHLRSVASESRQNLSDPWYNQDTAHGNVAANILRLAIYLRVVPPRQAISRGVRNMILEVARNYSAHGRDRVLGVSMRHVPALLLQRLRAGGDLP